MKHPGLSRLRAIAIAAVFTTTMTNAAYAAMSADEVVRVRNILSHSVVRIDASDCRTERGGKSCGHSVSSTGFFADVNGQLVIVTTLHGVAYYPSIQWIGGTFRRDTSILSVNTAADIALLEVPQPDDVLARGFAPLKLSPALATGDAPPDLAGHDVIVLGYKLGLAEATAEDANIRILGPGTIGSLLAPDEDLDSGLAHFFKKTTAILQLQHRLDPGDSGGPVIDNDTVIGIAHGGIQGSSLNWAMPAGLVASATEKSDKFLSGGASDYSQQGTVLRVFSTQTAQATAHPVVLPIRYSFALKLSQNTSLLMDYASRIGYTTTGEDNNGYWTFGKGPISRDSEAFPGGGGNASGLYDSEPPARKQFYQETLDKEALILEAIDSANVQLECQTPDNLKFGEPDLWPTFDPALHLDQDLSIDRLALARDRSDLFIYTPNPLDLSGFGQKGHFKTSPRTGNTLTDQDLKFALCSIGLTARPSGDPNLVQLLNKAMLSGNACFAIYLSDGTVLQTIMVGQSPFSELDPNKLYSEMFPITGATSDYGQICDF